MTRLVWNFVCAIGYLLAAVGVATDSLDPQQRAIATVMLTLSGVAIGSRAIREHLEARLRERRR